jgi:hypothetical protein
MVKQIFCYGDVANSISISPVNRVFEVLCVTQLTEMCNCDLSYNTVIFIIFTEGCYISLSLAYESSLHLLSLVNLFVVNLMTPNKSKDCSAY